MTSITRSDGKRFIIPSYRDVLSAKKAGLLQREIRLLASSYGDYINLQRKNLNEYEVAYSSEPGVLLGETAWSYFKRPNDMVYCEELPDTNEVILVVVKGGSVYLDGSFAIDSIISELIVFQTQDNHFDIYIYGNVPISQTHEEGKFSFDSASVNSFNVLDKSVFLRLPLSSQFELVLVDQALRQHNIGVFPTIKVVLGLATAVFVWAAWHYFSSYREALPEVIVRATNPYQNYENEFVSPAPSSEIQKVVKTILLLYSIPGWVPDHMVYQNLTTSTSVKSLGVRTKTLFEWAKKHNAQVLVANEGYSIVISFNLANRPRQSKIYKTDDVISNLTDRLSYILPGNSLTLTRSENKELYTRTTISINFSNVVPATLEFIALQLKDLPLVLTKVEIDIKNQGLSGKISLMVLGN